MGMAEDRFDAAVAAVVQAERMYAETENPFWVLQAIAASDWVGQSPPKWASAALFKAATFAWQRSEWLGKELSLDDALGLKTNRGKEPAQKAAARLRVETDVLDLVKVVINCFAVSIPEACEVVYHAIDYDFARMLEDIEWGATIPKNDPDTLKLLGITPEQLDEMNEKQRARDEKFISVSRLSAAVEAKVRGQEWWTVTWGDHLGYSLDTLIDRYYRKGSKRRYSKRGKADEMLAMHFEGYRLRLLPERLTHHINYKTPGAQLGKCESAVSGLELKPGFAAFIAKIENRGL